MLFMFQVFLVLPSFSGGHVLVVDFGTLSVESQLQDKSEDLGVGTLPTPIISKFTIQLNSFLCEVLILSVLI